ncbi:hypothetical protein [Bradyrhizobium liaoningense]|nr:hypothetical protein [Bradyrhizobium liaoningense]MBR0997729.1 hypothetical protein [Bradyrhizobium liaoningense]
MQPHPGHSLRSLTQLAARAEVLALSYDRIEKLLDTLGEKIEATTEREQLDQLIAAAQTAATLNERDQALLEWCEAALSRLDADSNYESEDGQFVLKPSVVAARIAMLVGAFPAGAPSDPAVYVKMLMEHVCAIEGLGLIDLDAAIWEATASLKFIPAASEFLLIVTRQRKQWHKRLMAVQNIAEVSSWTLTEIDKLQAEAMARVQQAR